MNISPAARSIDRFGADLRGLGATDIELIDDTTMVATFRRLDDMVFASNVVNDTLEGVRVLFHAHPTPEELPPPNPIPMLEPTTYAARLRFAHMEGVAGAYPIGQRTVAVLTRDDATTARMHALLKPDARGRTQVLVDRELIPAPLGPPRPGTGSTH